MDTERTPSEFNEERLNPAGRLHETKTVSAAAEHGTTSSRNVCTAFFGVRMDKMRLARYGKVHVYERILPSCTRCSKVFPENVTRAQLLRSRPIVLLAVRQCEDFISSIFSN